MESLIKGYTDIEDKEIIIYKFSSFQFCVGKLPERALQIWCHIRIICSVVTLLIFSGLCPSSL
jgi:hypothetical protein